MTIKDIAKIAGCGVATVSRVINNHPDVTDKTRKKVLAVMQEYNYQPNINAKHLKQQYSSSIAILVKGTHNLLFAEIVEQVKALLLENKQESTVYYLDEDANEVQYALELCRERHPKGFMFLGGDLEHFQESFGDISVPSILLTNTAEALGFKNLSSVTTDDYAAAEQVIDYLIECGHHEIGIIGGNQSCFQVSHYRLQGCKESFHRHEMNLDESTQYEPCRFAMEDGYQAARRLLERRPETTAIFALGDVIAIGVVRALHDMGRRVPEDISVVGYDGIPTARFTTPRLATVQQDTSQLALRGTDILLRNIERVPCPMHEVSPFRLIQGESVASLLKK